MNTLKRIALALVIIGGINWGLIGLFQYDLVAAIFGGQDAGLSRLVYTLVGLGALISLAILFDPDPMSEDNSEIEDNRNLQTNRVNYGTEFGEETEDITSPDHENKL